VTDPACHSLASRSVSACNSGEYTSLGAVPPFLSGQLEETGRNEAQPRSKSLSVVGGVTGTVLGARRSKVAAVIGGLVGGTLGYFAGKVFGGGESTVDHASEAEPVVVTVGEDDNETTSTGEETADADESSAKAAPDDAEDE
jgi:phage tail tape-measure protein